MNNILGKESLPWWSLSTVTMQRGGDISMLTLGLQTLIKACGSSVNLEVRGNWGLQARASNSEWTIPGHFFNAEKQLWQWFGQTESLPQFSIRDNFCAALANMDRKRRGIHFSLLALIHSIAGLHIGRPFPHYALPLFCLPQVLLLFKHRDKSWCGQIHPS